MDGASEVGPLATLASFSTAPSGCIATARAESCRLALLALLAGGALLAAAPSVTPPASSAHDTPSTVIKRFIDAPFLHVGLRAPCAVANLGESRREDRRLITSGRVAWYNV